MANERFCDGCGSRMSPRWPRRRDDKDRLLCSNCTTNPPERSNPTDVFSSIRAKLNRGFFRFAHDSGDGETIYHCPFCGAGQVIARSDGTAECQFCDTSFTVQVQPSRPASPQTIDGQPHVPVEMPGEPEPGGFPDENEPEEEEFPLDEEEEEDNLNLQPFQYDSRRQGYRTARGQILDEDAYMRHLAIRYGDDRDRVLQAVRASRRA